MLVTIGQVCRDHSGAINCLVFVRNCFRDALLSIIDQEYSLTLCHRRCSSRPAGNDVIGIDLGTTNSCVSVMEGKVRHSRFLF